jgi:uncharacterized short protein YbdD (DUF466 family)
MNSAHHTRLAAGRALWSFIRSLARDNAYELYLEHHRAEHPAERPLSRREFYLREQQRKWGGITRCC